MMITMKRFILVVAIAGLVHLDIAYSQSPSMPGSKIVIQGAGEILGFGPDRQTLATHRDKKIQFWDVSTGQQVRTLSLDIGRLTVVNISPDGATLWTMKDDNEAKLWNSQNGKLKATVELNNFAPLFAFSQNGRFVGIGARAKDNRSVALFDLETGNLSGTFIHPKIYKYDGGVENIAFWGDDTLITSNESIIYVWSRASGKIIATLIDPSLTIQKTFWTYYRETSHGCTIYDLSVSNDGKFIATASCDGRAKLWDLENQKFRSTLVRLKKVVIAVKFSPNGKLLAVSSEDRTVRLFDTSSSKQIAVLQHKGTPHSVEFSPDGRLIATGADNDHSIKIWDVETGNLLTELKDARYPAIFSPDGRTLVTGGEKNTVMLWDVPFK